MVDRAIREGLSITVDFYLSIRVLPLSRKWSGGNVFSPNKSEAMFSADASEIVIVSSGSTANGSGRASKTWPRDRPAARRNGRKICGVDENTLVALRNCITEENIEAVMQKPYSMIGSDGIPTETGFSNPRLYGTFPRVLGRFSRDRKVLPPAEAVHKMTGFPASRFRLAGRGVLREGAFADIVVFDYDRIMTRRLFESETVSCGHTRCVCERGKGSR